MVFKQGEPVEKILGADVPKLQRVVRDLANMAGNGGASASGSGSGNGWRTADLPKGYKDVSDQVDVKGLELLNADSDFAGVRILFEASKPSALDTKGKASSDGGKDWVESDTDEQLMLFAPFQATLKVHTLQVRALAHNDRTLLIHNSRSRRYPQQLQMMMMTTKHQCVLKLSTSTQTDHIS